MSAVLSYLTKTQCQRVGFSAQFFKACFGNNSPSSTDSSGCWLGKRAESIVSAGIELGIHRENITVQLSENNVVAHVLLVW